MTIYRAMRMAWRRVRRQFLSVEELSQQPDLTVPEVLSIMSVMRHVTNAQKQQ